MKENMLDIHWKHSSYILSVQIPLNWIFYTVLMEENYMEHLHVIKLLKISILGINIYWVFGKDHNIYQDNQSID